VPEAPHDEPRRARRPVARSRPPVTARARSRGRSIALASACASVALVAAGTWVSRGSLLETWYIHRLGSDREDARLAAAEKLGEMSSLRALPRLLKAIRKEDREHVAVTPWTSDPSGAPIKPQVVLTPLLHALYEIGPAAAAIVKDEREHRRGPLDGLVRRVP